MRRVRVLCLVPCFIAGVRSAVPSAISIPGSSTSPTATPTALLYFNGISELTTCEQATFTWEYSGPASEQLVLAITNDQVEQSEAVSGQINVVIADDIDPSLNTYTWHSVDIPPAWYRLNASIPSQSLSVLSTMFYVHAGTNTTCLAGSASIQSHSGSHTNVGAIVGGVLGGVIFALAVALIYLFYTRKSAKSGLVSPNSPYTEDRKRGRNPLFSPTKSWDQLGSVDSHMFVSAASGSRASHQRHSIHSAAHKSFSDSVNLPVLEYSRDVSRTSLNGDEEKGSPTSICSFKSPAPPPSDSGNLPHTPISRLPHPRLDAHAAPEQAHIQDSRRPDKTHSAHLDGVNSVHGVRGRKPSDSSSLAASTIMSLATATDHGLTRPSSTPPNPHGRSQSDLTRKPTTSSMEVPASAPKSSKPRRAVRKPVPLYDPSTDPDYINTSISSSFSSSPDIATPSSPTNANHPLYTEDPFARPVPVLSNKGSTGTLNGTGGGHYVSRTQTQLGTQRELVHKNSFGFEGRQMHYLIPDNPLPQKK